jgi:hypothetical protein
LDEGVLQATDKVVGRLTVDRLAVRLARVQQHEPEYVRLPPLAVHGDDRRTDTEIDLRFFTGGAFQPPKRQRLDLFQSADVTLHRRIAASEAVLGDQILVNPLSSETKGALGLNRVAEPIAVAVAGWRCGGCRRRPIPGVHRETVSRHVRLAASSSKPATLHAGTGLNGDAPSAADIDFSRPAKKVRADVFRRPFFDSENVCHNGGFLACPKR